MQMPPPAEPAAVPQFDPVALAVITSRVQGIVRRMTNTLFRTARSSVLNTARDFSCCLVTREQELLATAEALPIHVMSGMNDGETRKDALLLGASGFFGKPLEIPAILAAIEALPS